MGHRLIPRLLHILITRIRNAVKHLYGKLQITKGLSSEKFVNFWLILIVRHAGRRVFICFRTTLELSLQSSIPQFLISSILISSIPQKQKKSRVHPYPYCIRNNSLRVISVNNPILHIINGISGINLRAKRVNTQTVKQFTISRNK